MKVDRRTLLRTAGLLGLALIAPPVAAAEDDDDDDDKSPLATARFPQPVQVGQLIGRDVLQNLESQPVLGRVRSVVRGPSGQLSFVMSFGGWFGWGGRLVAVPLQALSLLGGYMVATGLTLDQLGRLPTYDGGGTPLPPGNTITVGLTKPAH